MIKNNVYYELYASIDVPSPETGYWIDLGADAHGNIIKFFDPATERWVKLTDASSEYATPPYIGNNYNWWVDNRDTGINATGKSPWINPDNGNWMMWDPAANKWLDTGFRGEGYSAYELAIKHGYVGTEEDWLYSLKKASEEAAVIALDSAKKADEATAESIIATDASVIATDESIEATDNAQTAADRANEIAGNPPKIVGGIWFIYDEKLKKYVSTGIQAIGEAFEIKKTYPSIQAMNDDFATTSVTMGQFVMISALDVDDPEDSQLFMKDETTWKFVTDLSGAQGFQGLSAYEVAVQNGYVGTQVDWLQSLKQASEDAAAIALAENERMVKLNTSVTAAETIRVTSEDARKSNETTRNTNENSRKSFEDARRLAETQRSTAEGVRNTNENKRISQEESRVAAELAKVKIEESRVKAETDRVTNESTRITNETSRETAETTRKSAETTRNTNEETRVAKEAARVTTELGRVSAESSRNVSEGTRNTNEANRLSAESTRVSNEGTRQSNETTRTNSETNRNTAEETRSKSEGARVESEVTRDSNEDLRIVSETGRTNAEVSRTNAEKFRAVAESQRVIDSLNTISSLLETQKEVAASADRADALADNPPIIKYGTWWFYDEEEKIYKDSGSPSIDPIATRKYIIKGDITAETFEDVKTAILMNYFIVYELNDSITDVIYQNLISDKVIRLNYIDSTDEFKVVSNTYTLEEDNTVTKQSVSKFKVENTLTSNAINNSLSAAQGKVLNETKVDKVSGKGLSTEDYTTENKTTVSKIRASIIAAQIDPNSVAPSIDLAFSKHNPNTDIYSVEKVNLPTVTNTRNGLMANTDKVKLDAIPEQVYSKTEVDAKVSSVYRIKGSVATEANLPTTNVTIGDVYNVDATDENFVAIEINPIVWDKLGSNIDLSGYSTTAESDAKYINASGDTMTGTLNFNSNNVQSSIFNDASYFVYSTNAAAGHKFNKNIHVAGILYGGPSGDQPVWHTGNFNPASYLPLTGGPVGNILVNATDGGVVTIKRNGVDVGFVGQGSDIDTYIALGSYRSNKLLKLMHTGDLLYNDYKVWHSGNGGAGSGLDADLLDGRDSTAFAYANDRINSTDKAHVNMLGYGYAAEGWPGSGPALVFGESWYQKQIWGSFSGNSLQIRTNDSGTLTPWRHFAFEDSNVASATKLATPRTIWGQSFDGTGNVSGTWAYNGNAASTNDNVLIKNGYLELYGKVPALDFHFNNSTADYTSRIIESALGRLAISDKLSIGGYINDTFNLATASFISNDWVRTTATTGWYSQTYNGGIHMIDSDYVRVYNDKKFYVTNASQDAIRSGGGFYGISQNNGTTWANSHNVPTLLTGDSIFIAPGTYHPVIKWSTQIRDVGYVQHASIGSYRWGSGFGAVALSVGSADDNSTSSQYFFNSDGAFAAPRIVSGFDGTRTGGISCSNWFASSGNTGWVNDTYGGGIYMTDSTFVKVYGNKSFWANNGIHVSRGGAISDSGNYGAVVATQPADTNNYCHYALVRSGSATVALGMNTSNELIIGACGFNSVLDSTWVTISRLGDITAKGDVVASKFLGVLEGNASTATKLQTARTINGVAFDGTANISLPVYSPSMATDTTDGLMSRELYKKVSRDISQRAISNLSVIDAREASNFICNLTSNTSLNVTNGTGAAYQELIIVVVPTSAWVITIPTTGDFLSMCGSSHTCTANKVVEFSVKWLDMKWRIAKLEQE